MRCDCDAVNLVKGKFVDAVKEGLTEAILESDSMTEDDSMSWIIVWGYWGK